MTKKAKTETEEYIEKMRKKFEEIDNFELEVKDAANPEKQKLEPEQPIYESLKEDLKGVSQKRLPGRNLFYLQEIIFVS